MIRNKILERLQAGEQALGVYMIDPSDLLVEMAGRMGLDFVQFDGQHWPLTPERVGTLCMIADGFDITPVMRIPDGCESTILSFLDKGIRMIVVPNLKTKEEAEALVQYTYFAPIGVRSSTSIRTVLAQGEGGRPELYKEINANTMLVPQFEHISALENVGEILSVAGIDYFTPGFEDQAHSMGLSGQADSAAVQGAWEACAQKVRAAGKHIMSDHIEYIDAFGSVKTAAQDLLEKHGRKSQLPF